MKRSKRFLGRDWPVAYIFIAPLILLLFGLIAYPLIRGVIPSFYNYTGITNRGFVGLDNYERLWVNRQFRSSVWITVQYATIAVFFKFWIGLIAGVVCCFAVGLKSKAGYDDALDVVAATMPLRQERCTGRLQAYDADRATHLPERAGDTGEHAAGPDAAARLDALRDVQLGREHARLLELQVDQQLEARRRYVWIQIERELGFAERTLVVAERGQCEREMIARLRQLRIDVDSLEQRRACVFR